MAVSSRSKRRTLLELISCSRERLLLERWTDALLCARMSDNSVIRTDRAPAPVGAYSQASCWSFAHQSPPDSLLASHPAVLLQAIQAGGSLFVSGQLGLAPGVSFAFA